MLFKLLFPGVIFHELSHYLACIVAGVKVHNVRLFGFKEAFVQHEVPTAGKSIAITLAPFALNNLLGIWLLFFAHELLLAQSIISIFFYWISISFIFHSFPSTQDAMNSFNATKSFFIGKITKGKARSRLAWLIISPVVFIPVLLLTGLLLVIDSFQVLKVVWLLLAIAFTMQPGPLLHLINNLFI